MPNIAQQDYIIFDAQGAQLDDIMDELRALVTKIYKTDPLNLLSIVVKDYCTEGDTTTKMTTPFSSFAVASGELEVTSADNNIVVTADIS